MAKEKLRTEENVEIIKFAKVLFVVIVIIVGIYFFTRAFVTKDLFNDSTDTTDTESESAGDEISYDVTTLGSLLNRPYKEYYVLAYNSTESLASYYKTVAGKYTAQEKHTKLYYADLNTAFNKNFIADESKLNVTNVSDLKVKGVTLFKIKSGKIIKAIEDMDAITKELAVTEK